MIKIVYFEFILKFYFISFHCTLNLMFLHNFLIIKDSFHLIKLNNYPNLIKTIILMILDNYFILNYPQNYYPFAQNLYNYFFIF